MGHLSGDRSPRRSVVAVLGLAVVLAGCGGSGPTPPATASSPQATATVGSSLASGSAGPSLTTGSPPSPTPSAAGDRWRLVPLPDSADAGIVADIAARPGLVVAVGSAGQAAELGVAWTSTDQGSTWVREPLPGPAGPARVVPWGRRVLVTGTGQGPDCAHPSIVRAWVRAASGDWRAAPFDPIFCVGGAPAAATLDGHAVIAGVGSGDVGYAWSSDAGLTWQDRSTALGERAPRGVTVDGQGFAMLETSAATSEAWVTRSADGTTWSPPAPLSGLPAGSNVKEPITVDGAVAIFVADTTGSMRVYRVDPAGGWRSTAVDGLRGDTLARIVAVEGGLVALGGDDAGPSAWASADGVTWRAVARPGEVVAAGSGATLTGAAVEAGRAFLVGQVPTASGDRAIGALWDGPATLLAP